MLLENWHRICSIQACYEPSISKKRHLLSTEQSAPMSVGKHATLNGQKLPRRDFSSLTQHPLRSIHPQCRTTLTPWPLK